MAIVPEFNPGGNPSPASTAVFQGLDMGQSIMDRAQRRQIAAAQEARQQEDWALQQPVRRATAQAQAASEFNNLVGTQQMAELSKQANLEMPELRHKWKATYSIGDETTRLATQDALLADASRYSSLKGIGDEIHQWHEVWTQGQLAKRGRDMITGRSEVAELKAASGKEIAQTKADAAATLAQEKADRAAEKLQLQQKHDTEMIQLRGQSKVETEDEKIRTQAASKSNEKMLEAGAGAVRSSYDLKRGLALLDDPDIRTGTGARFELKAKRLGQLFGFDTSGVSSGEELQKIFGDAVLARVNQTKGSISDKEMTLFDSYSASMNKSPEGNKAIMTALLRAQDRAVQIAKMVNDARRAGKRESEIQNDVNDFILNHDIWEGIKPPGEESEAPAGEAKPIVIKSVKRID
jgi:hypothetical protein